MAIRRTSGNLSCTKATLRKGTFAYSNAVVPAGTVLHNLCTNDEEDVEFTLRGEPTSDGYIVRRSDLNAVLLDKF